MTRKKSKQDTLIDELLKDGHDPKDILGSNGLIKQLTQRLVGSMNRKDRLFNLHIKKGYVFSYYLHFITEFGQ